MLIARIPGLLACSFKNLTWELPAEGKKVFLTFDDGPTPEVTEWVLEQLEQFGAKATFFCLGNNVEKHPAIFSKILAGGHAVGNHSYSHIKGFRYSAGNYLANVDHAAEIIGTDLFRPPYGRIRPGQIRVLKKRYRIIMWTVLSVDYNRKISGRQVVKNVVCNVRPGSIIVFHDSIKASENLYHALPEVLKFLKEKGYEMSSIK
ncbi:MAG: polysaccharide deacetylase family protein [Bacteroidales bacterium]|nr:polysaccharide deacetylase family protein [Bacteroidales bacterium]